MLLSHEACARYPCWRRWWQEIKVFSLDSKEMTFRPVPRNLVIGLVYFEYVDPMKTRLEFLSGLVKISKC